MSKQIMIVDDEEEIVDLLAIRLNHYGYSSIKATDVVTAVKLAFDKKPDLIIMDIKMPDGGGEAVCEKLQTSALTSSIPVFLISALTPQEIQEKIKHLNVAGYLSKPFDIQDLHNMIKKVLN